MTAHRRITDRDWWRTLRRDLAKIAAVTIPAFFLAYACTPMFDVAEAGGTPEQGQSNMDCYPSVEPSDLRGEGWRRVKGFDRLRLAGEVAARKVETRRFETLTCIDYTGTSPQERPGGEWWWRPIRRSRR